MVVPGIAMMVANLRWVMIYKKSNKKPEKFTKKHADGWGGDSFNGLIV